MVVEVLPSKEAVSARAFALVSELIRNKPACVLGLATGSTPVRLYELLVEADLDWSQITTFNLDEYLGMTAAHPQSYQYFMRTHLFSHVNLSPVATHLPEDSDTGSAYEHQIRSAGGIDLQVLGIGSNGHIGFNEPGSALDSRTRRVGLSSTTIADNARFFGNPAEVPTAAITMGIGTIMEARSVVLMAMGAGKADAVARAVEGPVTPNLPASVLQNHADARILLDTAAASLLRAHRDTHT